MVWLNKLELKRQWATTDQRRRSFLDVFSVVLLLRGCYLDAEYEPDDHLVDAFSLTPAGEAAADALTARVPDVDERSRRLAVAVHFLQEDLLVAVDRVDMKVLVAALARGMADGSVCFYQEYGRVLYDRFFDMFPTRTSQLTPDETRHLVEGLPTLAPYHVGNLTVGPLGPVPAASFRLMEPSHTAPLWHCSDSSCNALHTVRLQPTLSPVVVASTELSRWYDEKREPPSEWDGLFRVLGEPPEAYYNDFTMPQLPWLLADGFVVDELQELVNRCLELDPGGARKQLAPALSTSRSSAAIAAELDAHAAMQLLLILDENLVGRSIDACVLAGDIKVPATERRRPVVFKGGNNWSRTRPEVGPLGLRTVSKLRDVPLLRLETLIKVTSALPGSAGLEWELRYAALRH